MALPPQDRHRLNLDNPRDLNEWINRLSLRTDTSQWSVLADKYRVRRYVEEAGHGDMLTRLYGVWDNAAIDFDALPDRFILKANHGSAMTLAVPDRSALDIRSAAASSTAGCTLPLAGSQPSRTISPSPGESSPEELLDTGRQDFPSTSLIDYKVWCFHGAPRYICVYYDRTPSLTVKRSVYDTGWRAVPNTPPVATATSSPPQRRCRARRRSTPCSPPPPTCRPAFRRCASTSTR